MADRYLEFTHTPIGRRLASALGLPSPPQLRRAVGAVQEQPLKDHAVLIGGSSGVKLSEPLLASLSAAGAELRIPLDHPGLIPIKQAAQTLGQTLRGEPAQGEAAVPDLYAFDASGIDAPAELNAIYDFFHPRLARMPANARIVLLVEARSESNSYATAGVHAALRGFVRSLAKEVGRRGTTVNLLEVAAGGSNWLAGPLRFLLSDQAAFVTGQVLGVGEAASGVGAVKSHAAPLAGKVAVVTGAARGIGAAIAQVFAREGARVVGIDRKQEEAVLGATLSAIGGYGLALDVTAADAGDRIAQEVGKRFGSLDIVVHNAGVTRDKMLKNMPRHYWEQVLEVNFASIVRITERLLGEGAGSSALRAGARLVCISSIAGIAGNAGQTNYAATKAGVIGFVDAAAAPFAARGLAINAVAPGYIETQMTAAMPPIQREVGRRMSSLAQGGLPQDIAEAVLFLASPAAGGVNGRTLRVCGQNFVGA
jgi:3-oxoacyl-[acyl-carrier protein] reductase